MSRRVVRLVERRTRELKLPAGEVAFLLAHARHVLDVVPAFRRGFYRLTPRGHVGWFDTPTRRFEIRPKVPWPTVRMLLGLPEVAGSDNPAAEVGSELLDILARELAERLRAVVRVGLAPGYREHDTAAAFLRGKLRPADQLRDAAARAFPDRFQITESVLDLDTPWNRIPRAVADALLANPDLPATARTELRDAALSLDGVSPGEIAEADFAASEAEPRAAHYRSLLELCRLLHAGFAAARFPGGGRGAFLLDLSRAFERWLTESLAAELGGRAGWSVEPQPGFPVGETVLQPDILIRHRGEPRLVLDAKWKAPGRTPDAADLHQILAYAAVTGARHVGLVYPGRRFARRELALPNGDTRVSLVRVRVVGTTAECDRSAARLARLVRGRVRKPGV